MEKRKRILFKKNSVLKVSLVIGFILVSFFIGTKFGNNNQQAGHDENKHQESTSSTSSQPEVWTCSMHPSIHLPKFGQCPICFMDLIPVEAGAGGDPDSPRLTMSENAKKLAGITTTPVIRKGVASDIRLVGKVAFDESRIEKISARIAGRIDRLYVDFTGVKVKAGYHLAEIYSPELVSLQKELIESANALNDLTPNVSAMVRESAKRTLIAAKEKLRLLGFTEREMQGVLTRGKTSDNMTIRSTQSGVVIKKLVDEGQYVKIGTPLFQIADLRKVWVKLDAYESDLAFLRLGQRVEFTVEAFPDEKFHGTVTFIDPVVNPQTRTIMVRVNTVNREAMLKPDMFVKARVKVAVTKSGNVSLGSISGKYICPMHPEVVEKTKGNCPICYMELEPASDMGYAVSGKSLRHPLIIPLTAPLFTGERSLVYIQDTEDDEPTFEGREVVLGPRVGDYYVVKSGLKEGDQVVVHGAFKIDGELQIRARPSMMNPKKKEKKKEFVAEKSIDRLSGSLATLPRDRLESVYSLYLDLSDRLATDDFPGSLKLMKAFKKLISSVSKEKGEIYQQYNEAIKIIKKRLEKVEIIQNIAEARAAFEILSEQVIGLEKRYGHRMNKKVHLTYCPMAFNDKGAYWLQTQDVVNNPYFGSQMLKCGAIKESYDPKKN